ncbi:uncharacterized protein MONBRDRAFT_31718 [Monosiga brevicollis MX1]|uniref:COMM domain-containing protein n=1 Tax=Monosiga brevicollis TaxID=81824 RepID=A9UVC1_MONBE|nr:uncharacterized protein MONBRDRAFT_31718 [Monosiga brevicollis MX1]EDQ91056.1 predicted protein [Monosiga brevicollis MX1]|eukprot:XP_001744353.1 hypothetical protein [Monosiga brevicollis MX1]
MTFHFGRKPDEQWLKELRSADQLPDEASQARVPHTAMPPALEGAFAALIELVFQILTAPQSVDGMVKAITTLGQQHDLPQKQAETLVKAWLMFFRAVQRASLNPKQLFEDVTALGYGKGKATFIAKQFKAQLAELSMTLVGQTFSIHNLVDMQWKFGVTAGSSVFEASGETFLQLKLTLNKGQGNEDVYMELTLPQFYEFLRAMESAKQSLEALS